MKKAKPGRWYFYVECPTCEEQIIFQKAPAPELVEHVYSKGVTAKCPHCGKEDTYPAARVARDQEENNKK